MLAELLCVVTEILTLTVHCNCSMLVTARMSLIKSNFFAFSKMSSTLNQEHIIMCFFLVVVVNLLSRD